MDHPTGLAAEDQYAPRNAIWEPAGGVTELDVQLVRIMNEALGA
jgi:hypothetical protein